VPLLELHLARIKASADELGFAFDRHETRNRIQALCFELEAAAKLRLLLSRSGEIALETAPLPAWPDGGVACVALPLPVVSGDWRLRHKTTDRAFYETALAVARDNGAGEVLLVREDGLVTEGSYSSVFVERGGKLLTPAASLGLLPGVLRQQLLDEGRAAEAELALDDLAGGFLLGNAVRGLTAARILP
jgi:para-aminobenzoate synthetase/4-amino-4-deoxychorismate lyase